MRQRVMIAMAMALDPALLIADEPTTALDVTVQAQVLERDAATCSAEFGTAIILITHDLGVVAEMADDVVVMYAGTVMERARRRDLFYRHQHPYTEGLLASLPAAASGRPAHPDPRHPAEPDQPAARLPVRAPLPVRVRPLPAPRRRHCSCVSGDPGHQSACWLAHGVRRRA